MPHLKFRLTFPFPDPKAPYPHSVAPTPLYDLSRYFYPVLSYCSYRDNAAFPKFRLRLGARYRIRSA
jgi:hypothetical protein